MRERTRQRKLREQRNLGMQRVNINEAGVMELQRIDGIGSSRAQAIVRYRDEHGGFSNVDELNNIPEFSGTLTDDLRNRLAA